MGAVTEMYSSWPLLPELFPVSFPGVKTSRDELVVDIDRGRLLVRMRAYFNPSVSDEELRQIAPAAVTDAPGFDFKKTRTQLLRSGFLPEHVVRYAYRPFDDRWLHWERHTKLLDRNRADYFCQVFAENLWMSATQQNRKAFSPPVTTRSLGSLHLIERGASMFPVMLGEPTELTFESPTGQERKPNLTDSAFSYLAGIEVVPLELFMHALAQMHAPSYARDNAAALRLDWPRIPLPNSKERLLASAELGRKLVDLFDPEADVDGVTAGNLHSELRVIGLPSRIGGGPLNEGAGDLAVTAAWGHAGQSGVTMPGKGRTITRPYAFEELAAIRQGAEALGLSLEETLAQLGEAAVDVYLNDVAYWRCVPCTVWSYTIGGYQVMKKWLSYREKALLARDLKVEEVREVMRMARRIAAVLLLQPALDANYEAAKASTRSWNPEHELAPNSAVTSTTLRWSVPLQPQARGFPLAPGSWPGARHGALRALVLIASSHDTPYQLALAPTVRAQSSGPMRQVSTPVDARGRMDLPSGYR